jgi:DNA-binding response OmpR family regulator
VPLDSPTSRRLLRALVAEDDPGIRTLIASMLALDGWDVRQAADGAEAVAIAGDWHPDAVVLDAFMPGTGGLDALRALREEGEDCAVVVVSALPSLERDALDAGADAFLAKPFRARELSARARAAVRWAGAEVEPDPADPGSVSPR